MKQNESALVCLSGGQDSTTCLYWALKEFRHVETVCFSYGQKHALEVDVARRIAEKASVDFSLLDLSLLGQITHNALTDNAVSMDKEKPADALPNTFVPGRNMLFLTLAAIKAYERGIGHLVTGVSQTDFSGYPDCRDTFIRSLNVSLNLAMDRQFVIHSPLMWLDKEQEWAMADELGIFDLVRYETLTCYNGIMADGCGECPACKLRRAGLERYLAHRSAKRNFPEEK